MSYSVERICCACSRGTVKWNAQQAAKTVYLRAEEHTQLTPPAAGNAKLVVEVQNFERGRAGRP